MSYAPKTRPVYWLAGLAFALVLLSLAAAGLLAVRMDRVGEPAFVFLTWNLFLAWIPFVLSLCVAAVHGRGGPRPLLWVFGAGWLLFLPNAPYILTDFIHLGRVGGAPLWFDAALIGTFAAAGLALGLASLLVVHHVVEARAGRVVGWAVAVSSLVLSAIGIYLGRFPRFNSWDVVTDPHGLVAVVLQRLADPLGNPFLLRFGCGDVDPAARLLPRHLAPRPRPPRAGPRPRSRRSPLRSFRSAGVGDARLPATAAPTPHQHDEAPLDTFQGSSHAPRVPLAGRLRDARIGRSNRSGAASTTPAAAASDPFVGRFRARPALSRARAGSQRGTPATCTDYLGPPSDGVASGRSQRRSYAETPAPPR